MRCMGHGHSSCAGLPWAQPLCRPAMGSAAVWGWTKAGQLHLRLSLLSDESANVRASPSCARRNVTRNRVCCAATRCVATCCAVLQRCCVATCCMLSHRACCTLRACLRVRTLRSVAMEQRLPILARVSIDGACLACSSTSERICAVAANRVTQSVRGS